MGDINKKDLLVVLNIKLSKKYSGFIVETLSGRVKKLKNKKYSGQSVRVDVFGEEYFSNISDKVLAKLRVIFSSSNCQQIEKDKIVVSKNELNQLAEEILDLGAMFIGREDRSKKVIERMSELNCEIQRLELIFQEEALRMETQAINATWVLDSAQEKGLEQEGIKTTSIVPEPILYLHFERKKMKGELHFRYGQTELAYHEITHDKLRFNDNNYIFRNRGFENQTRNFLEKANWLFLGSSCFSFNGKEEELSESLKKLQRERVLLMTNEKKKVVVGTVKNVKISYHMDWFSVSADYEDHGTAYRLSELIEKRSSEGFIELDSENVCITGDVKPFMQKGWKSNGGGYRQAPTGGSLQEDIKVGKWDYWKVRQLADKYISKDKRAELFNAFADYRHINLNIPLDLNRILRGYQSDGAKWMKHMYMNGFGGCLADDMGLGKTLQTIAFLSDKQVLSIRKPSLIVMPKTLIHNWRTEIEKFNVNMSICVYHGEKRKLELDKDLIFTTYGTLLNDIESLKHVEYNVIIFDEVQKLKNIKTKGRKAAKQLIAQGIYALSGTPMENHIGELWSVLDITNPGMFGTANTFKSQYWNEESQMIQKEALIQAISPFVLRRLKKDVLDELPSKTEKVIYCTMSEEQKTLYEALRIKLAREINQPKGRYQIKDNSMLLAGISDLRTACCDPQSLGREKNVGNCTSSTKLDSLKEILSILTEKREKVVVFSQFTRTLKRIKQWIEKNNWKCYYLDGESYNRGKIVENFENDQDGIFLVSLKAAGYGINLTSACYAVMFDPWWNPAVEKQAGDRIYRFGQNRAVTIYRLITEDTIEEQMELLKQKKADNIDSVFGEEYTNVVLNEETMIQFLKTED